MLMSKLQTGKHINAQTARSMRGTSMIEVLVTIVILAIGLLGLAGMETRLQKSEMDSYQRAQALILLNDMAARIAANRYNAASYVTGSGSPLGAGMTCPPSTGTQQQQDSADWCNALQGAAETNSTANVGAMIGGRGCVEQLASDQFLVTVAWQGLSPSAAPPGGVACGQGNYDNGTTCTNDSCRRAVTTIVRIGNLS
jgi:type IV pilus assembly protein PilV